MDWLTGEWLDPFLSDNQISCIFTVFLGTKAITIMFFTSKGHLLYLRVRTICTESSFDLQWPWLNHRPFRPTCTCVFVIFQNLFYWACIQVVLAWWPTQHELVLRLSWKCVVYGEGCHPDIWDIGNNHHVWLTDYSHPTCRQVLNPRGRGEKPVFHQIS